MRRLVPSTPKSEVSGISMLSLMASVNTDELKPILVKHGVDPAKVTVDSWYSLQTLLNIYRDIESEESNVSENFVSIGMKIIEQAAYPPEIQTVEEGMGALGVVYRAAHRNQTEQGWITEFRGDHHALITADNPYPDDLCYGIVWATARRFLPKGTGFEVTPLPVVGDEPARYEVKW